MGRFAKHKNAAQLVTTVQQPGRHQISDEQARHVLLLAQPHIRV